MEKSRRLTGFLRALRERRAQSLPVMSKRLSASLRSILSRKTDQLDLGSPEQNANTNESLNKGGVAVPSLGRGLNEKDVVKAGPYDSTEDISGPKTTNYLSVDECDQTLLETGSTEATANLSRKPSTKKEQEIIDWVNQQPPTTEFTSQDKRYALPAKGSALDTGRDEAGAVVANNWATTPTDDSQARCSSPEKLSPRKLPHGRNSQDPKSRGMLLEPQYGRDHADGRQ
jgi:hypothetical protein